MLRIQELREEKGLTQGNVAEAIGTSRTNIGRWEKGLNEPSYAFVVKLANFFDVSVDYLIGNDEERNQSPTPINTLSQLTDEERELLKFFRAIGKPARDAIFTTAKSFYEQLPADKRVSYTY